MSEKSEMSFLDHLVELRQRVVHALWGVVVGFIIVYSFSEKIFQWLSSPLCEAFKNKSCQMITTGVAEAFLVYLKTGILGGLFLASPWIFFQIWKFISPGLHARERRLVVPFVLAASIMFLGGALFGYFFIFPFAFEFFLSYANEFITPMPAMSSYFGFSSSLLIAFGLLFEIPVFVILLNLMGVVEARSLWKTWRVALFAIFALSALLTPADPITMVLLGVPLSILYILSLIICSLLEKSKAKPQAE
jgi:sec-independent protein translocase protein TatC